MSGGGGSQWTSEDDARLRGGVSVLGTNNWATIATMCMRGHSAKSCKERWFNVINVASASGAAVPSLYGGSSGARDDRPQKRGGGHARPRIPPMVADAREAMPCTARMCVCGRSVGEGWSSTLCAYSAHHVHVDPMLAASMKG
jgi:hypothetical protein